MADLFLDDQNLAHGTTPAGRDFDDFEIVLTGFFFGELTARFSFFQEDLTASLIWRVEQDGTVLTGYDATHRNAIVQLTIVGTRYITEIDGESDVGITVRATLLDSFQSHVFLGDDIVQLGSATITASSLQSEGSYSGSASIELSDDVPVAGNDFALAVNGLASGNVLLNDTIGADDCSFDGPILPNDEPNFALASLADGHGFVGSVRQPGGTAIPVGAAGPSVVTVLVGQYGLLQIDADGNWSYSAFNDASSGQDVFVYTIQDCDGDIGEGELIITIPDRQPTGGAVRVALDDDILPGGNPAGPGDDPDPTVPLAAALVGADGDEPLAFAFLATGAPAGFTYDTVTTPGTLYILQGQTRVVTVAITDAQAGAIAITQNAPVIHETLNGLAGDDTENNQLLAVTYTVTDRDGDVALGSLEIAIDDDTPVVRDDAASIATGNTVSFDARANDSVGADGSPALAFAAGSYGAVTINADGTQTYALNAAGLAAIGRLGGGAELIDTVRYTLTDRDGDSAAGNILVTLIGRNDPPVFDQDDYAFLVWEDSNTFTVSATDPDDDPLDYAVGTPAPQSGTVTGGEDGQFAYQPQVTQPVVDGFAAVATDPDGATDTAQVTVLVALAPIVVAPLTGIDFSIF